MMQEAPKAAVFDLGGVIIRVRVEGMFEHWARVAGADAGRLAALVAADGEYRRFERGEMSPEAFHRHIAELTGVELDFEAFRDGWNNVFDGLFPGVEELLADLAQRLRLVALTNTNELHGPVWRRLYADVLQHFETIFLSYEMKLRKPEPGIYRAVLDYLGEPPERVLFIDDRAENVAAAGRLGMQGIVADDPARLRQAIRHRGVDV